MKLLKLSAVIISFSLVLILSCNKDNEVNKGPYLGTWELAKTISGGVVGIYYYNKGNGNIISLDANGNFTQTVVAIDTFYTVHYTYHLEKGKACGVEESSVSLLKLSNNQNQMIMIEDTLLRLSSITCTTLDFVNFYRKIN